MSDPRHPVAAGRYCGEEAAQWWTLLHGEDATAADRREFLAWVVRSPERIEAYLEVERLMRILRADTVHWPDTPIETLVCAARASVEPAALVRPPGGAMLRGTSVRPGGRGAWRRRPASLVRLAAAATALGAVALVCWLSLSGGVQVYHTRRGEQRSILLADGSRVTLNSAATVEVDLRKHRRVIHLLRGEALFQVSHDPQRPFDVYADGHVVRAIGTEFNVDLLAHYAAVTVLQGRVAVMSAAQADLPTRPAWSVPAHIGALRAPLRLERFPAPAGALILGVAQEVLITPQGLSAPRAVRHLAATTAWTHRQLVFEARPLGEVVDELDRAGSTRIVIASAALRARKVTGVIELDDPGSLLRFLTDVPGAVVQRNRAGQSVVTLERKRPSHVKDVQLRMSRSQP